MQEKLEFNDTSIDNSSIPILWPLSYPSSSSNATKEYVQFTSIPRKPFSRLKKKRKRKKSKQTLTTASLNQNSSSLDNNTLFTQDPMIEQSITELSDDPQAVSPDENFEEDDDLQTDSDEQTNQSLDNEVQPDTYSALDKSSKSYSPTPSSNCIHLSNNPLIHTRLRNS